MGFEPTHVERNGLAVHRLNHSATSSMPTIINSYYELKTNFLNVRSILELERWITTGHL